MIFAEFLVSDNRYKLVGRDWASPDNAFVASHDLIEHFPDDTGTIEDEMRALGTSVWLRADMLSKDADDNNTFFGTPKHFKERRIRHRAISNLANDMFYTLKKYNVTHMLTAPIIALSDTDNALFQDVRELASNYWSDILPEVADNAIAWAKLGFIQSLERYKDAKYSVPKTFTALRAEFYRYHRDYFFDTPLEGTLYIAVDTTYGTIESEFIHAKNH